MYEKRNKLRKQLNKKKDVILKLSYKIQLQNVYEKNYSNLSGSNFRRGYI